MPRRRLSSSFLPVHRRPRAVEHALAKLGIQTADVWSKPRITPHIDELRLILQNISYTSGENLNLPESIFDVLETSDDPDARKVLEKYYSIPLTHRRSLEIEAFCVAAGVPTLRVLELIVGSIVHMNHRLSEAIANVASPAVVRKTVEMALTDEGTKDRELIHKATGFIPTPRGGPSVRVNVNQAQTQQAAAVASAVAAPRPEETIQRLVDRFNDARPAIFPQTVLEASSVPVDDSEENED